MFQTPIYSVVFYKKKIFIHLYFLSNATLLLFKKITLLFTNATLIFFLQTCRQIKKLFFLEKTMNGNFQNKKVQITKL